MSCLDITGCDEQESTFLPIYRYLKSIDVDYRFDSKVLHIELCAADRHRFAENIKIQHRDCCTYKRLGRTDILILAPGSTTSESMIGTSHSAPAWSRSDELAELLDESWSLWLQLSDRNPGLGDPYNFCTRQAESMLESFTITTGDESFIRHLKSLLPSDSEAGTLISLQKSQWKINLCLPMQPVFTDQPAGILVAWGFATFPTRKGSFVRKAMTRCSGTEILCELLGHLNLHNLTPTETTLIPRIMPRMSASLLTRSPGDRPAIQPEEICNIGLVGQFVEIPGLSSVDVSYGVHTAKMVVSKLMGLGADNPGYESQYKSRLTALCIRVLFGK